MTLNFLIFFLNLQSSGMTGMLYCMQFYSISLLYCGYDKHDNQVGKVFVCLFFLQVEFIIEERQVGRELKAGIWRQKPWRNTAYWFVSSSWLCYLSYTQGITTHSCMNQEIKKMPKQNPTGKIDGHTLFPAVSS